jgi:hypothetical protein
MATKRDTDASKVSRDEFEGAKSGAAAPIGVDGQRRRGASPQIAGGQIAGRGVYTTCEREKGHFCD